MKQLKSPEIAAFRETVWQHYRKHAREMPWREDPTPYKVLVSELMLQQTQVARVIPKFNAFLYTCPDFASLSRKSLADILSLWSGLGYNRRAKFLHHTARVVTDQYGGHLPDTVEELVKLPGIGKNTAGAIMAYAFNQPVVFVETNIRTVFFHHFFPDTVDKVSDTELAELVQQTLEVDSPREWYWALMDYGSYLKQTAGGRIASSKHYAKQAPLQGSLREMRGRIIRVLTAGPCSRDELYVAVIGDERFEPALVALHAEGLVKIKATTVHLTGDD